MPETAFPHTGTILDNLASALPEEDAGPDVQSESAQELAKRTGGCRFSRRVDDEADHKSPAAR